MKLLLYVCCAPCLIYPLEKLRQDNFEVAGFFYNPNIHPFQEFNQRKKAVEDYSRSTAIDIIYPEYAPADFFQAVNLKETKPDRCSLCWSLRLKKTAEFAKEKGFSHISTTLLVSPYQDQGLLQKIGGNVAREENVEFYFEDFRLGFRKAHDAAKSKGIYCQKYCGCIYSEIERYKKKGQSLAL